MKIPLAVATLGLPASFTITVMGAINRAKALHRSPGTDQGVNERLKLTPVWHLKLTRPMGVKTGY